MLSFVHAGTASMDNIMPSLFSLNEIFHELLFESLSKTAYFSTLLLVGLVHISCIYGS